MLRFLCHFRLAALFLAIASMGQFGASSAEDPFAGGALFPAGLREEDLARMLETQSGLENPVGERTSEEVPLRFTGTSENELAAVLHKDSFSGQFSQKGNATGLFSGVTFAGAFSGEAKNEGLIRSENLGMLFGSGPFSGTLTNSGKIEGRETGIFVMDSFEGEILNSGTIEGIEGIGIDLAHLPSGVFRTRTASRSLNLAAFVNQAQPSGIIRNDGGRISGGRVAIQLGFGDGTVILSGPSRIDGIIDGGPGFDTLRFENMRGIHAETKERLRELDESDSSSGSVILFSRVIQWDQFESIEVYLASLQSYESLITAPGLSGFARALDNPQGLGDEYRNFLNALNTVEEAELDAIAANLSGQSLLIAWDEFGREQNVRLFALLGNQFSSVRNDVSGREQAAQNRNGLFSNEVPAGASWDIPDRDFYTFANGFVGGGDYDPSLNRSDSRYDATSMVFGVGRQVSDHWNLGVFGGYGRNEAQVDSFGSELETRSVQAGVTAQYENGMFFANFVAGYGFLDSESMRRDFLGNTMTGDREGDQALFYLQSGWDFTFGKEERGRVTPYWGLVFSSTSLDGFTESGPAATSLRFQDDSFTSFQSVLGMNLEGHVETGAGWIKPQLDVAFWQAMDGEESSTVSLATPGFLNPYTVGLESSDQSSAVLQLGGEFSFDALPDWIFNAGYFGSFGDDGHSSHGGMIGVKIDF